MQINGEQQGTIVFCGMANRDAGTPTERKATYNKEKMRVSATDVKTIYRPQN